VSCQLGPATVATVFLFLLTPQLMALARAGVGPAVGILFFSPGVGKAHFQTGEVSSLLLNYAKLPMWRCEPK
jgi:hypothetical protein